MILGAGTDLPVKNRFITVNRFHFLTEIVAENRIFCNGNINGLTYQNEGKTLGFGYVLQNLQVIFA